MNINEINLEIQVISSEIDSVEQAINYEVALEEELNELNAMMFACESYDQDALYYGEMQ